MRNPSIEILLATYNGEKYLEEQLDSILTQTFQDFRILVRDDQSSDSTLDIIKNYMAKYPQKVSLLCNDDSGSGPIHNFSKLITASTAQYILLSDQDDFWLPNKIEKLLFEIKHLETVHSSKVPILVHSDLSVVNHELVTINSSFWNFSGINANRDAFGNLLIQNVVTGCASIFNRALANLCGEVPNQALMHDWWLALIASSLGVIGRLNEPLVLYRQHEENTLGAQEFIIKEGCIFS